MIGRRIWQHALAMAILALAVLACRAFSRTTIDAGALVPSAEAAKLMPYLPPTLGAFTASAPATSEGSTPGPLISARRTYANASGQTVYVRLATGNVHADLATLDSEDEHAFGSDSPTYWRTMSIAGHRARIAEERPKVLTSTCLVRVGPNHIADVRIAPASAGECAAVTSLLDFAGIAATGGVPSPATRR